MECFNCNGEDVVIFLTEELECQGCGEIMEIEYSYCNECDMAWKSIDGNPVFGMEADELDDPDAIAELFEHFEKESMKPEVPESMGDYVHRCIKCNSVCYEIDDGIYKCSDEECGFSWEVIKCE